MLKKMLLGLLVIHSVPLLAQERVHIIPRPVSVVDRAGDFLLTPDTKLVLKAPGLEQEASYFNDYLQQFYGFKLALASKARGQAITLGLQKVGYKYPGAYRMSVGASHVVIEGDNPTGVFYALQSLIQMLPVPDSSILSVSGSVLSLQVPCADILDYPRFAYRGLHLDVGRHFFPPAFVKKYIDLMAHYKYNTFHWHLTEDQGWRIEIKRYPLLTSVGSMRSETEVAKNRDPFIGDGKPYGGFYTQDEIRDIVAYATARHITIIPEIEMPGHSLAALTAYPYLGCTGGPYAVGTKWGVYDDVYCAGNDSVFTFLENVLDEVMALFPSKYIHIGGDECPKTRWKTCPKCQKRMHDLGLKNEDELQSYFIHRIEQYLNSKGRSIIGWDEILEGGLAPNATVMSWRGEQGGIAAAQQHHNVVMTPGQYLYFDHYQANPATEPLAIGGYLPVDSVYSYDPVPSALTADEAAYVLGAQGNVWTEYMASSDYVEYMVYPRAMALSEVLWTKKDLRNYGDFLERARAQESLLKLWKVHYAPHIFAPGPDAYVPPRDTAVQARMEWWRDQKFGLLMHWGTYSQWGIVESWSICPEDEGWTQRRGPYASDYFAYKKAYENLQTTFNPVHFDPVKWAKAAHAAGMRYMVFTTKHHDGFCMFDTHQTDYKITSTKTPFHTDPRANVALEVFKAFRDQGIGIGAYFSKPDWHSENYWWPYFPPKDRNVNYDPVKYPQRWQAFKDYTYNQIQELMTGYGHIDILWLDGGWVQPYPNDNPPHYNQDIDMPRIAAMARSHQPGLIVVDRAVGGPYENYRTPEQQVPTHPLDYPWETCMTMGNSWSYVPGDHYKPASLLVHLLVRIVAWGGNFLLNIGPNPDGDYDSVAYARLAEIGSWMDVNGSAIYGTRMVAPYGADRVYYTRKKDGSATYVFYLSEDGQDEVSVPGSLELKGFEVPPGARVTVLGSGRRVAFHESDDGTVLEVPNGVGGKYAVVFEVR